MRKKILTMSIVAILMATTSLSVVAFDAKKNNLLDVDAEILVQGKADLAGYQGNLIYSPDPDIGSTVNLHPPVPSFADLELTHNGRGDALIFPLFTQNGAGKWGSEIVVRNTNHERAIVAKVAVYAKDDSREVLDFNIYLSASDVVRFKIENGFLTSKDGSILRDVPAPQPSAGDYVDADDFASSDSGKGFKRELSIDSGYIVVYGMAQALRETDSVDSHGLRYHKQHARLFRNYRRELDSCRPGWRIGHHNAMENGTYTRKTTNATEVNYSVAAPNQAMNCNVASNEYSGTIDTIVFTMRDIKKKADEIKDDADTVSAERVRTKTEAGTVANSAVDVANKALDIANNAVTAAIAAVTIINAIILDTHIDGGAIRRIAEDARDDAITARDDAITARDDAITARANVATATATATVTATNVAINYARESTNNAETAAKKSIEAAKELANATQAAIDAVVAAIAAKAAAYSTSNNAGNFFGDVGEHLTGTVRLYSEASNPRDMMLPAKAIKNFTQGNKIIYVEGEIGALQDRRIKGSSDEDHDITTPEVNKEWARYNETGIRDDIVAFLVSSTTYTFAKNSEANQLVITQPYKRILVQLGNDDGYWQAIGSANKFGGFSYIYNVFNEHEEMDNIPYTHSPYGDDTDIHPNEVEALRDLEKDTEFAGENGYALIKFTDVNGNIKGIPAVITQMIGTKVGGIDQLNWIYSQTNSLK